MVFRRKSLESGEKPTRGFWYNVLDVLLNVVIIVGVVAVVRTFLASPFQVEGNSMVPALEDKQYIIIDKISYWIGSPARGDVVVFRPPDDNSKYYVKRVTGIPGDTVVIREGKVYLEEEDTLTELAETFLDDRNRDHTFVTPVGAGDRSEVSFEIPDGHYFLLGDNRQGSLDSRSFRDEGGEPMPYVQQRRITGRVWLVALPITKSHALERPEY
jgi:signal peptidase I